ncbi:hypothetical protein BH20ACT18_BH20ACT18_05150 [soil metagenome]|jgi:hypothetical protein
MTAARPPRYRVCVYELRDGKTTQVIDVYGTGFITATATHFDGDDLDIHFASGGPRHLQQHIAAAIADEHPTRTRRPR